MCMYVCPNQAEIYSRAGCLRSRAIVMQLLVLLNSTMDSPDGDTVWSEELVRLLVRQLLPQVGKGGVATDV